jgi:hypothetical protein
LFPVNVGIDWLVSLGVLEADLLAQDPGQCCNM